MRIARVFEIDQNQVKAIVLSDGGKNIAIIVRVEEETFDYLQICEWLSISNFSPSSINFLYPNYVVIGGQRLTVPEVLSLPQPIKQEIENAEDNSNVENKSSSVSLSESIDATEAETEQAREHDYWSRRAAQILPPQRTELPEVPLLPQPIQQDIVNAADYSNVGNQSSSASISTTIGATEAEGDLHTVDRCHKRRHDADKKIQEALRNWSRTTAEILPPLRLQLVIGGQRLTVPEVLSLPQPIKQEIENAEDNSNVENKSSSASISTTISATEAEADLHTVDRCHKRRHDADKKIQEALRNWSRTTAEILPPLRLQLESLQNWSRKAAEILPPLTFKLETLQKDLSGEKAKVISLRAQLMENASSFQAQLDQEKANVSSLQVQLDEEKAHANRLTVELSVRKRKTVDARIEMLKEKHLRTEAESENSILKDEINKTKIHDAENRWKMPCVILLCHYLALGMLLCGESFMVHLVNFNVAAIIMLLTLQHHPASLLQKMEYTASILHFLFSAIELVLGVTETHIPFLRYIALGVLVVGFVISHIPVCEECRKSGDDEDELRQSLLR